MPVHPFQISFHSHYISPLPSANMVSNKSLLTQNGVSPAQYLRLGSVTFRSTEQLLWLRKILRYATHKKNLPTRWAATYPEQLRPAQLAGHFGIDNYGWWKNYDLNNVLAD